jgi:hypothetical protein
LNEKTLHNWSVWLFWISLAELVLGGGGRLTAWEGISLRMVLFGLCQLTLVIHLLKQAKTLDTPFFPQFIAFFCLLGFSAAWGWYQGAAPAAILKDVKPLLFWANLAFYGLVIQDNRTFNGIRTIFLWSTLVMATAYLALLLCWHNAWIDAEAMHLYLAQYEEFSFRGSLGFMYKGFVFVPVGIFFWLQHPSRFRYVAVLLLYLALLFTFTRGFWLILFAILFIYTLLFQGKSWLNWTAIVFMLFSLYLSGLFVASREHTYFAGQEAGEMSHNAQKKEIPLSALEKELSGRFKQGFEHREASMIDRFVQVREVADAISPQSLLLGHGFGHGTASRPVHMEITYLEIFHKQGLLGLLMCFWLLFTLLHVYAKTLSFRWQNIHYLQSSFPFVFGCLFFFGLSFLNPFVNSPLGLGMLAITMLVLRRISEGKINA